MSNIYDLDALLVEADQAEPFRFVWGGVERELPALMAMPAKQQLAALDAINAGNPIDALRLILGDKFDELTEAKGSNERPMTTARLVALLSAWIDAQGLGKSQDSPASSAGTAQPSKPTSRSARARRTR